MSHTLVSLRVDTPGIAEAIAHKTILTLVQYTAHSKSDCYVITKTSFHKFIEDLYIMYDKYKGRIIQ